jgi:Spy/CpxP family protein refolding chaperone
MRFLRHRILQVLTLEQRKVFDDLTPFGGRAHKWKHRGGPRHQGAK